MSENYKIGLTRSRLYAFENTVVFVGKCKDDLRSEDCHKALMMLTEKEPLLTAAVVTDEDSSAYAVTGKCKPEFVFSDEDAEEIRDRYRCHGMCAFDKLFEFTVCKNDTVVIAGHTIVCDCKSLMRLAMAFAEYYERKSLSVEPSDIMTFPDENSLPANVNSPLTDKLSADLDSKWKKNKKMFGREDYTSARATYADSIEGVGLIRKVVSEFELSEICGKCTDLDIDVSSAVAFAFFTAVKGKVFLSKKARKISVNADRRFFVAEAHNCSVGPFNGLVDVSLKKKDERKTRREQMKAFHLAHYKGVTSAFRAFYNDLLLMKLSPEFCDASCISGMGVSCSRAAKRLAENYGCADGRICEFFSCNMAQNYWSGLGFYEEIAVAEPFKFRFASQVVFLRTDKIGQIEFFYNKGKISGSEAAEIVENAMKILSEF